VKGVKVGIIGASGYVGGELLRLLLQHGKVEVVCATSRRYCGEYVFRVHPNLRGLTDLQFTDPTPDQIALKCDLVFTAVPHGESVKIMPKLIESGLKIIDLSADFRLHNPEDYERWYGYKHPHPELLSRFVYGVPELHREEIRRASYVACPGCMAVTSILALAPFIKADVIDRKHIVVDAKIGSSGGGAKPSLGTHHAERYGVIRPYKPVGHRHTAEIEQELSLIANEKVTVSMSPHAVNTVRGILCTIHTYLKRQITVPEVWRILRSFYREEPFIRFVRDRKGLYRYPDPKVVIGSNFCDIGFEIDEHANRLVLLSATDNLMKGAAGSAVQCMNLMLGFDERTGLNMGGLHPV
jgi:N-acetyl-gamma-glutamyl-phosphate/LysW-gamma-L-alpha-aminoadipyl-6-phosphate reductase